MGVGHEVDNSILGNPNELPLLTRAGVLDHDIQEVRGAIEQIEEPMPEGWTDKTVTFCDMVNTQRQISKDLQEIYDTLVYTHRLLEREKRIRNRIPYDDTNDNTARKMFLRIFDEETMEQRAIARRLTRSRIMDERLKWHRYDRYFTKC